MQELVSGWSDVLKAGQHGYLCCSAYYEQLHAPAEAHMNT
jgi:hypothetical protein